MIDIQMRPMKKKMKNAWTTLVTTLLLIPLFPSVAPAASDAKDSEIGNYRKEGIDVVQRRIFRKSLRHEFSLDGGINADNQFLMYELTGFKYTFHFRETMAFEASYTRAFHQNKAIINDLKNIPCPAGVDFNGDGIPDTLCPVELQTSPDAWKDIIFGNFVWSPIYGKFSIFSKRIYHFDIFIVAGAGYFHNQSNDRFGFDLGLGTKIYLNDWCAIRLDFRNMTVREGAPFNHIINNRTMTAGVSFFLPLKPYE
jgi:outer membrane beta-barrel protein